jgi:hypothetical protein
LIQTIKQVAGHYDHRHSGDNGEADSQSQNHTALLMGSGLWRGRDRAYSEK